MESGFWKKLEGPISAAGPMAGVSDAAYREMLVRHGKPSVIWTEMMSTEGLSLKGAEEYSNELMFSDSEKPVVIQFFGSRPKTFTASAAHAVSAGYSGIDINMGCPDRNVEKQGAGASLIGKTKEVENIIEATREGAGEIPVSVKTRIGYGSKEEMNDWISFLAEQGFAAISIHGRIREELRGGDADWDAISEAAKTIKKISPETIVIGNGDVSSKADGERKTEIYGTDGYMAARATIGNPWLFSGYLPTKEERIEAALEHAGIFRDLFGDSRHFDILKTHFVGYMSDFDGAKELRVRFMQTQSYKDVEDIVRSVLKKAA